MPKQPNLFYRLLSPIFQEEINKAVRDQFASYAETDNTFNVACSDYPNLLQQPDRQKLIEDAFKAWLTNPLCRRIVSLTTQYVVGGGINFACKHEANLNFMRKFWDNPLNGLTNQVYEWCDELTRTGDLFILLTTDAAGMSYVRAIPTATVEEIKTKEKDVNQELSIKLKSLDDIHYPVFNFQNPKIRPAVLHFAINKPVGSSWGESDLAPILKWLSRYSNWLEDRARLNRYRTAFLYIVTGKFNSEADRIAREKALNATPPSPGSILVTNEGEVWDIISAKLESAEANEDGLALKKMIAAGSGLPMHFLAEPESSTRTTAEAAGGPTYRHFEQRQNLFMWLIQTIFKAALLRRHQVDSNIDPDAEITVTGSDISSRDNISLAMATSNILSALIEMRDRELIDDAEMMRLLYRFCGEIVDVEAMLARGKKAGPPKLPPDYKRKSAEDFQPQDINSLKKSPVNIDTGENKKSKSAD